MRCSRTVGLAAACLLTLAADSSRLDRKELHGALVGDWTGTLTYRDYRNPDLRVTLPTTLVIRIEPDSAALRFSFTYDDGPGKTVYSYNRVELSVNGTQLAWDDTAATHPETFSVVEASRDSTGVLRLVLETEGEDNDTPASLRKSVTIGRDTLRILKTVRPKDSTFAFRNEYIMRRNSHH